MIKMKTLLEGFDYKRKFGSENPISYEDYDADAITERIINKAKRRANP